MGIEVTVNAKNNTSMEISCCEPGAVFFDADGNVVGFCYGIEDFKAGEERKFNISGEMRGYGMDTGQVDSVQVFIQGDNWL